MREKHLNRLLGILTIIVCLIFLQSRITILEPMTAALKGLRKSLDVRTALDPFKGQLLVPLLKPRVPGTEGHIHARSHIVKSLEQFGWNTSLHEFTALTPHGPIPMANVVAYKNGWSERPDLTLSAHYDSKKLPKGFIGATDSAFPCALLLWLASITDPPSQEFNLIFFDGEESFENWTEEDSLYGSQALAKYQESRGELPSTLVLLDLIGTEARFPIPSWFANTEYLHKQLHTLDPQLIGGRNLHHLAGYMQDDHIPFFQRKVDVLHLIPAVFPDVWHTLEDNSSALHWPTIEAWANMMKRWLY